MAEPKPPLSRADKFAITAIIGSALATSLPLIAVTRAVILLFALGGALVLLYHASGRLWKRWLAAGLAVVAYLTLVLFLFDREAREAKTIAPTTAALRWVIVLLEPVPWLWVLTTAILTICITLLVQRRWRAKGRKPSRSMVVLNVTAPDPHAECKNTIRLLQEDLAVHSARADTNESIFKAFKEKYALAISMADYQASEIGKYVEVVRVCTHEVKLDDALPTFRWSILLKNRSVHGISLDGDVGPLFFAGHKLTEHKDLLENNVMGLYPERDGSIVFEQRLSPSEVNLLKSSPNGKVEFDKVMLYVKGSDAEHVTRHRVVIFSRFRATLGKCSDERSQAVEELSAEVDSLRAQLIEAKLNLDHEKMAERKTLIALWRDLVSTAAKRYWGPDGGDYSFTTLLELHEGYMTLSPRLSVETRTALETARFSQTTDVSRLIDILAEDIARIELEWGL